jgi:hypothetical protein
MLALQGSQASDLRDIDVGQSAHGEPGKIVESIENTRQASLPNAKLEENNAPGEGHDNRDRQREAVQPARKQTEEDISPPAATCSNVQHSISDKPFGANVTTNTTSSLPGDRTGDNPSGDDTIYNVSSTAREGKSTKASEDKERDETAVQGGVVGGHLDFQYALERKRELGHISKLGTAC